jgi:hypothetical protein
VGDLLRAGPPGGEFYSFAVDEVKDGVGAERSGCGEQADGDALAGPGFPAEQDGGVLGAEGDGGGFAVLVDADGDRVPQAERLLVLVGPRDGGHGVERVAADEERLAVPGVVALWGDADFPDLEAAGEFFLSLLEGGDRVAAGDPDGEEVAGEDGADPVGGGPVPAGGPAGVAGWRVGGAGVDDGPGPGSPDPGVVEGPGDVMPRPRDGDESGDQR